MTIRLIWTVSNWLNIVILLVIASLFATQFVIDMKYQELANEWNVLLALLSTVYLIVKQPVSIKAHLIAWVTLTVLFFLWWAFSNGLGFGDVKFMAATSFLLTTDQVIPYLVVTLSLAIVFGLGLMLVKRSGLKTEFAFGPFLILGMLLIGIA